MKNILMQEAGFIQAAPRNPKHWSAELIRIGNLAVRQAQTRSRQLGIPNWYSLNGRLVKDAPQSFPRQPENEKLWVG